MTLGERITTLRHERGWTLSELARALGKSRSYLYQVESDTSSPTLSWLENCARAFDLTVLDLLAPLYGGDATYGQKRAAILTQIRRALNEIEANDY